MHSNILSLVYTSSLNRFTILLLMLLVSLTQLVMETTFFQWWRKSSHSSTSVQLPCGDCGTNRSNKSQHSPNHSYRNPLPSRRFVSATLDCLVSTQIIDTCIAGCRDGEETHGSASCHQEGTGSHQENRKTFLQNIISDFISFEISPSSKGRLRLSMRGGR